MTPDKEILEMAPPIVRTYALSFLLLPFNIFSTYYFQAIMKPKAASINMSPGLKLNSAEPVFMAIIPQKPVSAPRVFENENFSPFINRFIRYDYKPYMLRRA